MVAPSTVEVVLDEWPLVVLRMPRTVDSEACRSFSGAIDKLLERRRAFAMVVDNRPTVDMPAAARNAIARWEKTQDAPLRTFAKALAIAMPNHTMFAVAALITWLNPPPYPKKCFLDEAEAKAWARAKLSLG